MTMMFKMFIIQWQTKKNAIKKVIGNPVTFFLG